MPSEDDDGPPVDDAIDAAEDAVTTAAQGAEEAGETIYDKLRQWFVTGAALIVPLVVTLLVIAFVLNFISNTLDPLVDAARFVGVGPQLQELVLEAAAIFVLVALVVLLGFLADITERNFATVFHTAIEVVPGVGGLYRSFRRMSDVFVESNTESFQEVKLVEFPSEGSYSLAFLTADTPDVIQDSAGELEMQTLFMPLAPNPVMGGFLIHLPPDRVHEIGMTVEEAVEAIVTSGVSVDISDRNRGRDHSLTMDELGSLGEADPVDESFDGDDDIPDEHRP
ncbi:DUF502 domain-containing protein [Halorientalis pallida]|uniref:DUF502 domain-containing protein n=1 Tax=Halorientalis pallida TaxID=2479928 RepID=UPI003C702EFA